MTIKKQFIPLVEFLEKNKNKKVESILDSIISMVESKKKDTTFIKDSKGNVIAIFCWYHKQWEILSEVKYGKKKNSTTGYNQMCKVGNSLWTKARNKAIKEKDELIVKVSKGEIDPSKLPQMMEDIEETRKKVDNTNKPKGYKTEDEVRKILKL